MPVKVMIDAEGRPYMEFENHKDALQFMKSFTPAVQTRRNNTPIAPAPTSAKSSTPPPPADATASRVPVEKKSAAISLLNDLHGSSYKVLEFLCEIEEPVTMDIIATGCGLESRNAAGGSCTAISRLAKRHGLTWSDLVISGVNEESKSTIEATPLLLSAYKEREMSKML